MQPPSASPAPPAFAGGLWSPLDELASTAWSAEEVEKYIVAVAAAQRKGHVARALELAKVPTDIKSIVSALAGSRWSAKAALAAAGVSEDEKQEKWVEAAAAVEAGQPREAVMATLGVPPELRSAVSALAGNRWSAKAALAAAGVSDKTQEEWVEAAAAVEAGQPREAVMVTLRVPPELRSAVSKIASSRRDREMSRGNQRARVTSATSPEGVLPKDEKAATELSGITGYSVSKETRMHYTEVLQKNNGFAYYRVSFIDAFTGEKVNIRLCDKRVRKKPRDGSRPLGKKAVKVLHGL